MGGRAVIKHPSRRTAELLIYASRFCFVICKGSLASEMGFIIKVRFWVSTSKYSCYYTTRQVKKKRWPPVLTLTATDRQLSLVSIDTLPWPSQLGYRLYGQSVRTIACAVQVWLRIVEVMCIAQVLCIWKGSCCGALCHELPCFI